MRRYESLGAFTAVCMVARLKYLRTLSNLDQRSCPIRRYGEQDQAAGLWPQPALPEALLPAWTCPSAAHDEWFPRPAVALRPPVVGRPITSLPHARNASASERVED
jgi:hypothetical protein